MNSLKIFSAVIAAATLVSVFFAPTPAQAGSATPTISPVQSSARPFGLDIVNKVMTAGSDSKSATFQKNTLPQLRSLANTNLKESKALSKTTVGLHAIDPAQITLKYATSVRTYFVGEGASFHNTLGFNPVGGGTGAGAKLIFPDASTNVASSDLSGTKGSRVSDSPVMPGDFVDMGRFNSGTLLNFFVGADAARTGKNVFSTQHNLNKDGLVHAVAYALPGSPYLLIGFEDVYGGGDKDYNDLLFTIDIGAANVAALSGPEPATWATLGMMLGVAFVVGKRRRSNRTNATVEAQNS